MSRIQLVGGAYQARSIIAGAQSCINLIPERVPDGSGEDIAMVHYPTPGLRLLATVGPGGWNCLYVTTTNDLYGVSGTNLYRFTGGTLAAPTLVIGGIGFAGNPVSMSDNGVDMVVVTGGAGGVSVHLATGVATVIVAAAFYGGPVVGCLDGYFCLVRPGTDQFYISTNVNPPGAPGSAITWDPLDIATSTTADLLVTLTVIKRELWIFGRTRTEIWSDVGAADFPLQVQSGGIEYGCAAAYSVAKGDGFVFWLAQDRNGQGIVLQGSDYAARRISTHAIENTIGSYATISDAIGVVYQLGGHTIYALTFPTANATWCYDRATELWHQWSSSVGGVNGGRHVGSCHAEWLGLHIVGNYITGALYSLEFGIDRDAFSGIIRQRAFPHLVNEAKRLSYVSFIADMQAATTTGAIPNVSLDWSDDRGATFGTPVTQSLGLAGASGATLISLQWRRLGTARDRVFRLTWTSGGGDGDTAALLGAYIEVEQAET